MAPMPKLARKDFGTDVSWMKGVMHILHLPAFPRVKNILVKAALRPVKNTRIPKPNLHPLVAGRRSLHLGIHNGEGSRSCNLIPIEKRPKGSEDV